MLRIGQCYMGPYMIKICKHILDQQAQQAPNPTELTSDTPATAPARRLATACAEFRQLRLTSRELVDEREGLGLVRHCAGDRERATRKESRSGEVCRFDVCRRLHKTWGK